MLVVVRLDQEQRVLARRAQGPLDLELLVQALQAREPRVRDLGRERLATLAALAALAALAPVLAQLETELVEPTAVQVVLVAQSMVGVTSASTIP